MDAVGLNCISGVRQLQSLLEQMDTEGLTLSVMPNSGSPVVIQHRTIYQSDPEYFGRELAELAAKGVAIVGGCCGTTPKHIAALTEALKSVSADGEAHCRGIRPIGIRGYRKIHRKCQGAL